MPVTAKLIQFSLICVALFTIHMDTKTSQKQVKNKSKHNEPLKKSFITVLQATIIINHLKKHTSVKHYHYYITVSNSINDSNQVELGGTRGGAVFSTGPGLGPRVD